MGFSGGGGSTNINVPPQIGPTTSQLGAYESQFLGEPLSLGNYGISMATGNAVPQIASTGFSPNAQNNPAQFSLGSGSYWQGSVNDPNMTTYAGYTGIPGDPGVIAGLGQMGGTQYSAGGMTGGGVPTPTANVGGQTYYTGQTIQYSAGQSYTPLYDQGGNLAGYQNAQGNFVDQAGAPGISAPQQINVNRGGGGGGGQQGPITIGSGGGANYYGQSAAAPYTSQVGGMTVPNQNPLYGPWINSAVSAIAGEASQLPTWERMMAQSQGLAGQYAGYAGAGQAASQPWLAQGQDIVNQGQGMVTQATTGTGLFPSQQALVDAQVKAGQSQINQQLANEGLSASTLGPELSAEIGLQGAATAGQLIQGNIAAGVSQEQAGVGVAGVGVNLQQAAQGWAQLGASQQALGVGEEQAIMGLFGTIASQTTQMQNQFWQQGLQGYGLEGAFLNSALSSYGTSLQAYNSILQASETQAQINEQAQANANTANASIISSAISAVGEVAGGAAKACWLARAVIPERWTLFRVWLLGESCPNWIRAWYLKHGERSAEWIKDRPIAKRLVRWVMNTILDISYGRRRR